MFEPELSAEECGEKAATVLPETCIQHLESNNWKERISSMDTLQKTVEEMKKSEIPCQALVRLLSQGRKETKLQVMQKKLHTITLLAQKGDFSRTSAQIVLESVVEMVGDVLCSSYAQGALTAIAESCSLSWTAKTAMLFAFSQNNSRIQSKFLGWLSNAILEFGFAGMEAKALVKTLKIALAAVHPSVQRSAITLLGIIYLYMGDSLKALVESEELPLLPQIYAELEKLHGQVPPIPSRAKPKPQLDVRTQEDPRDHRSTEAMDIGDRITPELVSKLQEKNWTIRREGLEEVASILQDARFIQPNIGELPGALRACLCDPNPTLVQMALRVLQQLPAAMGSNIKQHMKDLGFPLIALFRKSKGSVRAAALAAMNSWAAQINILEWLDGQDISGDLDMQELGQWLAEQLPTLKSAPSDLLRCVPHLYSSLQDSNRDVQIASQAALPFFIMHLGFEKMTEATNELKAAGKNHVLVILENANDSLLAQSAASAKSLSRHPGVTTTTALASIQTTPPAATALSSQASAKNPAPKTSREEKQGPKGSKSGTVLKDIGAAKGKAQMNSILMNEVGKLGPIFITVPKGKEQRMRDEKGSKVLQWNFTAPSDRYIKQLKAQMSCCVSRRFQVEMFHSSFPHHIKALAIMSRHLETEKEGVISCLDLILKWLTLRFFDTNTWVLIKSLDYLSLLLTLLIQEKYQLTDTEAFSFLPYLVLKMGEPRQTVLKLVCAILRKICLVYPAKKVFGFLMEGTKSHNSKQQEGCLVEMGYLLETYGLDVCQPSPSKALKRIAAFLGHQDSAVHSAALNIMFTASKTRGEALFKMLGNLPKEHMRILGQITKLGMSRVSSPKSFSENFHYDSYSVSEVTCQHAGDATSKLKPTCSQRGNFNIVDTVPQTRPPHGGQKKRRMVSRKYSLFNLKDVVQLETIPELQTLPVSLDADDTCHNITPTINSLICRISSGDTDTSIQAIQEIEEILKQNNKVEVMSRHINEFLVASFQSLKFINTQKEADKKWGKEQIILQCNSVIQACNSVFQEKKLAQEASVEVLKDVMNNLFTLMIDLLDGHLEEDQKLMQSINVLMKKVLEKSDQTRIFCALLKLLQDSLTAAGSPDKFYDLLAKCLWRTIWLLPRTISTLNLDEILLDIHMIMKALSNEELRQCTKKLPLWTLKTLLYNLCKLKGVRILDHLTLIEDAAGSEVETYLRKTVNPTAKQGMNETAAGAGEETPWAARRVAKDKAGLHSSDVLMGMKNHQQK